MYMYIHMCSCIANEQQGFECFIHVHVMQSTQKALSTFYHVHNNLHHDVIPALYVNSQTTSNNDLVNFLVQVHYLIIICMSTLKKLNFLVIMAPSQLINSIKSGHTLASANCTNLHCKLHDWAKVQNPS